MYKDTPNKEEIDWLAERMREIYDYEQLKDCDIDYLYNQEFGMQADTMIFEDTPPNAQKRGRDRNPSSFRPSKTTAS